ncbi:hypothetical protein CQA53_06540 [Helicobacter didelphidarum]|uniref:Globin n=1 Tax=Helicobacter didelphidarum TaxID=2040648 RepID=A0A3D8IJD8_9HELI|nr:group III truncated hemoglobin [Helicobacter didelphidarum]RDU65329.1 hypothetical protein CQA53_06540 [Helicobacter didelphidarum]
MKYNEINPESIAKLMEIFYNKIRKNQELGAIFNAKVGTDEESWKAHKEKIASFWRANLLGEQGVYNGYPLKAHLELDPFPREYFHIWLSLFDESLKEVYHNPQCQAQILQRAKTIAQRFQKMIYDFPHS